jgi:hypothetical protein
MRSLLLNPNGVKPEQIEFEAKIGQIQVLVDKKDSLTADLIRNLIENEAWLIMPEAKGSYPSFYNFNSGLPSKNNVNEQELFDRMLLLFQKQTKNNQYLRELAKTVKLDKTFNDGSRATYDFDPATNSYKDEPSEVIVKKRIYDINVKCAGKQTQLATINGWNGGPLPKVFSSDIRISASSERPIQDFPKSQPKSQR